MDVNTVLDRLETSFGRESLQRLLRGFSSQLDDALAALDRGEAREMAHRVAGISGTLGFAAAGRAWLALADGVDEAPLQARAEALQAQAIIAERTQSTPGPATSV